MQPHSQRASSAAFERFVQTPHLPGLDGLRCLAILPVIWHHATPRPLPGLLGKGAVGVDLFFAVSGFLITTLLLRERRRSGRVSLIKFYARRSLRIFPLYYLVLGGYVAHAWLMPAGSVVAQHFFRSLPYHATYTANWFVDYGVPHDVMFSFSWSLCVEEQFYWVWPVCLALLTRRSFLALLMSGAIALDSLAEHGALSSWLPAGSLGLRLLTSFAAPIGFGSLLALTLDTPRGFQLASRALAGRYTAPLLLAACLALLLLPITPYLPLSLALAALVGAVVLGPEHGLTRVLEQPALRRVGTYSYAAYLVHVTALGLLRRALPGWREQAWLMFCLGLPLTLLLAAALHRTIEQPWHRLRGKLR